MHSVIVFVQPISTEFETFAVFRIQSMFCVDLRMVVPLVCPLSEINFSWKAAVTTILA